MDAGVVASDVTVVKLSHFSNAYCPMVVTPLGIVIDSRFVHLRKAP